MSKVFKFKRGGEVSEIECLNAFDAFSSAKVFDVFEADGKFVFVEGCDGFYEVALTKEQLLAFAAELKALAES